MTWRPSPRHTFMATVRALAASLVLLCMATLPAGAAVDRAATEAAFRQWLAGEVWPAAAARGVSAATFNAALAGVSLDWDLPDLRPPGAPDAAPRQQRQAEFRAPSRYFSEGNLRTLARIGRDKLGEWRQTLDRIEAAYGVPRRIVVAIWGRETAYGNAALPHNAMRVIATQAFIGRRKAAFTEELLAALEIAEAGHVAPGAMKSSWAGALGHPQFLPSKFLDHAVDFDGDGHRDIWRSVPDSLASIAKYLRDHGWVAGRDWGYEAEIPLSVSCALEGPEQGRPVSEWLRAGARRVAGREFAEPEKARTGFLLMPAGRYGPAFIATENFYVLKAYNESDLYALFIGNLADRIVGGGAFVAGWRDIGGFTRRDVQLMQQRLEGEGFDVGGADGLVGFKTRTAVGEWQARTGEPATCFPSAAMAKGLR